MSMITYVEDNQPFLMKLWYKGFTSNEDPAAI